MAAHGMINCVQCIRHDDAKWLGLFCGMESIGVSVEPQCTPPLLTLFVFADHRLADNLRFGRECSFAHQFRVHENAVFVIGHDECKRLPRALRQFPNKLSTEVCDFSGCRFSPLDGAFVIISEPYLYKVAHPYI